MKKVGVLILLIVLLSSVLWGCSNTPVEETSPSKEYSKEELSQLNDRVSENMEIRGGDTVDLTALSKTMAYGEVFSIVLSPEMYMGKTIKMEGAYYATTPEENLPDYQYVVVEDAGACCKQGLAFTWEGEHEVPVDGSLVEVSGTFTSKEVSGRMLYYIQGDAVTLK